MVPIAGTPEYASVVLVNESMPVNSVQEFIAHAKKQPGKLTFATTGTGSFEYIGMELLQRQSGIRLVQVPYRGGMLALSDVLGGRIDIWAPAFPGVRDQIQSGNLKALAVTSPYRLPGLPDVPTLLEAGLDIKSTGWSGLYGPAKLPKRYSGHARRSGGRDAQESRYAGETACDRIRADGPRCQELAELQAAELARWTEFFTEVGLRK